MRFMIVMMISEVSLRTNADDGEGTTDIRLHGESPTREKTGKATSHLPFDRHPGRIYLLIIKVATPVC